MGLAIDVWHFEIQQLYDILLVQNDECDFKITPCAFVRYLVILDARVCGAVIAQTELRDNT